MKPYVNLQAICIAGRLDKTLYGVGHRHACVSKNICVGWINSNEESLGGRIPFNMRCRSDFGTTNEFMQHRVMPLERGR